MLHKRCDELDRIMRGDNDGKADSEGDDDSDSTRKHDGTTQSPILPASKA